MKKAKGIRRIMIIALCAATALGMVAMTGCGNETGFPYDKYELTDFISVGEYKGLEVEKNKIEVSEIEVKSEIEKARQEAIKNVDLKKGDEIKNGDTVNIDYVGRINGKKFNGGSDKGYDLKIGSGTFIEGFESQLEGKKIGDANIKVNVTFPEDYNAEELQGKDAEFTVTVNSGTRPKMPKYNDEFAKTQGDYKNTEEYEKALKDQITKQKKNREEDNQKMALWDKVITDSEVKKYPENEVNNYKKSNSEMMDSLAKDQGMTRAEVLSQYGFKDEQSFKTSNDESCKLRVKQELITARIAELEGITYTDEEKAEMIKLYEEQGYDDKSIRTQTGRSMDQYVCIQLLYEKVLDFILDNAKVK